MAGRSWFDVGVPMRDGTRLSADVYFPASGPDGGPYPAVVLRTPYDNQTPLYVEGARFLARHGFVSVLQDVRGRHDSAGEWRPLLQEGPDGYDTVEWVAAQPWCTGKVGTMGGSYGGYVQWALAREKPPHLTAMVTTASVGALHEELPWHNGVIMLAALAWLNYTGGRAMQRPEHVDNWPEVFRHLPVREMDRPLGRELPMWREWLDHPTFDDYWRGLRPDGDFARLDVPVLHITGWFDDDQPGALYFWEGMRTSPRGGDQHLVIGPWDHAGTRVPRQVTAGVDFGPASLVDVLDLHRRWFDRHLKDGQADPLPHPTRIFVTGENRWRDVAQPWPPTGAARRWYLRSNGRANTLAGDGSLVADAPSGDEPADVYTYDPHDPVPAVLDDNFYAAEAVETPLDRRFQHRRDDVLVYTTAPVDEDIVLAGFPELQLFAATDGPDTDWFYALHDVAPTGTSMELCQGRLRARFRESLERESLLEPGTTYRFDIRAGAVGHRLKAGHALRLTITSSDFPIWDRNLNTAETPGTGTEARVARNTVRHDSEAPSCLTINVIRDDSLLPIPDDDPFPDHVPKETR